MNKGYAFGFLIVLLVVVLGLYVAFTSFMSSREALRAQAVSHPTTTAVATVQILVSPSPTVTPTLVIIPTPVAGETLAATIPAPANATEPPPSPDTPASPPTEPPPLQPTDTPAADVQPPTPVPAPAYQYRLGGPPSPNPDYPNCCYIFGVVRDAAGNGLEGVQVQAFNEWNTLPPAPTKGGGEAGQYDIPIGRDAVTWYVVVVDAAGTPISPQAPIPFDPNVANGYRVNWQRTY